MITLKVSNEKKPRTTKYNEIPRPQAFRGRALNGPHQGSVGVFLKASAQSGGNDVRDSILYRLDLEGAFRKYVGTETDFTDYEPMDMEIVLTPGMEAL